MNPDYPMVPLKLKHGSHLRAAVQRVEQEYWRNVDYWRTATAGIFPDLAVSSAEVALALADTLWTLCASDADARAYWHQQMSRARIMSKFATPESWRLCVDEDERREQLSAVWCTAYQEARAGGDPHDEAVRIAAAAKQAAMNGAVRASAGRHHAYLDGQSPL